MKAPFQAIALVTLGSVALAAAAPADASQLRRFGATNQGPDPRGVAAQGYEWQEFEGRGTDVNRRADEAADLGALQLQTVHLPDGRVLRPTRE